MRGVNWAGLGENFFLPLLLSPVAAVVLGVFVYCLSCTSRLFAATPSPMPSVGASTAQAALPVVGMGEMRILRRIHQWVVNLPLKRGLHAIHFLSAGAVCVACAVNDTPNIAPLLLVAGALAPWKLAQRQS